MKRSCHWLFLVLAGLLVPVGAAPKVVLIHGEQYYGSEKSIPEFAQKLSETFGYETQVLTSAPGSRALPDLACLEEADLLILYIRLREASDSQMALLDAYFNSGKPAMALRTSSHGIADRPQWFVSHFGGHFKTHTGQKLACEAILSPEERAHPILLGLPESFLAGNDGIYHALPLSEGATPLVFGKVPLTPAEPVAWTMGTNRFYTSLGTTSDFATAPLVRMLLNASEWCLKDAPSLEPRVPSFPQPPGDHLLAEDERVLLLEDEALAPWQHWDPSSDPQVLSADRVADTTSGGPVYREARWQIHDRVLEARPGFGDIVTSTSLGDGVYHVDFLLPDAKASGGIYLDGKWEIQLDTSAQCGAIPEVALPSETVATPAGVWHTLQVAIQHVDGISADVSVWLNAIQIHDRVRLSDPTPFGFPQMKDHSGALFVSSPKQARACNMSEDFTVISRFRTEGEGPLFGKVHGKEDHRKHDKVLFISEGRLHYDIGYVGVMVAETAIADGDWHTVALRNREGVTQLFVDGALQAQKEQFTTPDSKQSVIKIAAGAPNFPEVNAWDGEIATFQFFGEALGDDDIALAGSSEPIERATPVLSWTAPLERRSDETNDDSRGRGPLRLQAEVGKLRFANLTQRPLDKVDHARIIAAWDEAAFERGEKIYEGICFACHGNLQQEGSLPTSRPFWKEPFKNGKDPHSLYGTLQKGYNQMPPQPWLTASAAYDVIHYIREAFVKTNNVSEYVEITPEYLASLPKGMSDEEPLTQEQIDYARGPMYQRMNFGPMLDWTYQVDPDNIAYKGIAIRLDEGPGGVSRGRHWMLYDHDTLRVAAAWSGNGFIDWKGIAFDQSHGTHASIVGEKTLVNPVGPGWANPADGTWTDPRFLGRDGKPYGPLPREWAHFKGQYLHGDKVVLNYMVGDAEILDMPSLVPGGNAPVFVRTLNIGESSRDLRLRIAPADVTVQVMGEGASMAELDGFHIMTVLAKDTPTKVNVLTARGDAPSLVVASLLAAEPEDLSGYLQGGAARWTETVTTEGQMGSDEEPFAVDEIRYPAENPYQSWMRIGGFDFLPGGKRAAVATWLGDVWLVDNIDGDFATHTWKRICTGLFQPLGVKWVNGHLYITCRDQLAKLHDLNGDEEIDFIESFNNDHQVTEHFHEFAMGLQTDEAGNFYYAKSARHAKTALVPHHGTLLRVSKDGLRTDILATGFRAANGVCLNPDGTYIVTDQEGHWNPKNRINYVKEGGFYGNMFGYHRVQDDRDEAMEQPLCWITNAFDRSPGELLWVPEGAKWGALNGKLLNLSYGMGKAFVVPHEKMPDGQAQGGMVSLGLEFPTGIMRGRFHPDNGQLYTTGMFAWAGSKHQDGGFYRVRATGKAKNLPIDLKARRGGIHLEFTDGLDRSSAGLAENYKVKVWGLKRTANYGSQHYDEHLLAVTEASVSEDGKSIFLSIPDITTTWCMEITIHVMDASGNAVDRVIHNTIHQLPTE